MDNQHQKINGYRDLSEMDIKTMNAFKDFGKIIGEFIEALEKDPTIDQRWLAIGKTDLQKGIMSCVRAVAKPSTF